MLFSSREANSLLNLVYCPLSEEPHELVYRFITVYMILVRARYEAVKYFVWKNTFLAEETRPAPN